MRYVSSYSEITENSKVPSIKISQSSSSSPVLPAKELKLDPHLETVWGGQNFQRLNCDEIRLIE